MRTNPHSTQILAAFVLGGTGWVPGGGGGGMVMFVGYYSAVVPHKVRWVLKIVPEWIIVPGFRRWRAGYGWSCGTAQGTQPCYLKRRHGGLLAGLSSTRDAPHMANPGRRLGTIFSTVLV